MPDEWCKSSLVPVFKNKGDIQVCDNYRVIKLMSHSTKAWEKVIASRMREESEVSQNQFGFMHMVFVDLEKAFDWVFRKVLW